MSTSAAHLRLDPSALLRPANTSSSDNRRTRATSSPMCMRHVTTRFSGARGGRWARDLGRKYRARPRAAMKHVLGGAGTQQAHNLLHATLEPSTHAKKPSSEIDELSSLS